MDLRGCRVRVDRLLAGLDRARANLRTEREEKTKVEASLRDATEAREIVQLTAQAVQQRLHLRIAAVVTRCLGAVFDDPYEFNIRFDAKRGKTEARLVLSRDGVDYDDPVNEVGGGVIDVVALALRLACILMTRPGVRRLLVLDEPFTNIRGRENKRRMRAMLLALAREMKVQFLLNVDVEAYPEFAMGKVVELG